MAQLTQLTRLVISRSLFDDRDGGCPTLVREVLGGLRQLQVLDLSHQRMWTRDALAGLVDSLPATVLRTLDLSCALCPLTNGTQLPADALGLQRLQRLQRLQALRELNLSLNDLGKDADCDDMIGALPHLPELQRLDLSQNMLRDSHAVALVNAIMHAPELRFLDLSLNGFTDVGVSMLVAAAASHRGRLASLSITQQGRVQFSLATIGLWREAFACGTLL